MRMAENARHQHERRSRRPSRSRTEVSPREAGDQKDRHAERDRRAEPCCRCNDRRGPIGGHRDGRHDIVRHAEQVPPQRRMVRQVITTGSIRPEFFRRAEQLTQRHRPERDISRTHLQPHALLDIEHLIDGEPRPVGKPAISPCRIEFDRDETECDEPCEKTRRGVTEASRGNELSVAQSSLKSAVVPSK